MALIVTEEVERCLCQKQGVLTVPVEDATIRCKGAANGANRCRLVGCEGIDVDRLPLTASRLQAHFLVMGQKFRERYRVRGFEPVGTKLWLHGPFPSYDFNSHLADVESALWREAEQGDPDPSWPGRHDERPDKILFHVFERELAFNPYADYVFLGWFAREEVRKQIRETDNGDDRRAFAPVGFLQGVSA